MRYNAQRADGKGSFPTGAITEIFVPQRHYTNGYVVKVTGGTVISQPDSMILKIANDGSSKEIVVTVNTRP